MAHVPVRSDLVLVHHRQAELERAFIISDRSTNRYWRVGPLQYEMARWFARSDLSWGEASAKLRAEFSEPITDAEIADSYAQFKDLGLLELHAEAVAEAQLTVATYRRALRLLGLGRSARTSTAVAKFLRSVATAPSQGPAAAFVAPALALVRAAPKDADARRLIAAFHRALHLDRTARENAHLPPLLRWMRIQVPLFDPSAQLERWHPRLRWMFNPLFLLFTVAVAVYGFYTYLEHARIVHQRLAWVSGNLGLFFFCTVLMLVVHEYAHALTCKHFGGEVREIGIIVFLFLIPAAYCDVSDAHLFSERRKKLWVTLAGTYSTFVLASLGALLFASTVPTALLNHLGLVLMASGYATVLTNLNPLLPLDGYFFLGDLLGIDNLRDRAPDYAKAWLAAFFTGRPRPKESPHNHRVFFVYFVVGTLYQLFYIALGIGFGWLLLVRGGSLAGLVTYVAFVYLFYVRNYLVRTVALWREAKRVRLLAYAAVLGAVVWVMFLPWNRTISLPAVVREQSRIGTIAPEAGILESLPAAGARVERGTPLFRVRSGQGESVVEAPAHGIFHPSADVAAGAPVAAGAEVGVIITGYILESVVPERQLDAAREAIALEATIMDREATVANLQLGLRRGQDRFEHLIQVGIVAAAPDLPTLQNGLPARVSVRSARRLTLWNRLWGDQWDNVILDVWRIL